MFHKHNICANNLDKVISEVMFDYNCYFLLVSTFTTAKNKNLEQNSPILSLRIHLSTTQKNVFFFIHAYSL